MQPESHNLVGPVLQSGETTMAVLSAIQALNPVLAVVDRGAYLRVLVPNRCVLTRVAVEQFAKRSFRFPGELEAIMPSFRGILRINDDEASWEFKK